MASASQLKGKLQFYLTSLPEDVRKDRIIPVSTRAVVEAELLKSTISLADYDSSAEEMISDVAVRRAELEEKLKRTASDIIPKAIYVVETSNTKTKQEESRPVSIWRTLVNLCKVPVEQIAVCTNTKELPKDAVRVASIDQLSDDFTHIIFNKKLQEGWDDPSVYACYFDGETSSATRIQQVLGRAVRQPRAKHFNDDALNTAYFFFNCPNELLEKITDQLKEELRIYKGDDDDPAFEPFEFKEERKAIPPIPLKDEYIGKLTVPRLQPELPTGDRLQKLILKKTFDFRDEDRAAAGKALINVVNVKTGDVSQARRDLLEDMRVQCGGFLYEQIRILSKNCASAIHPHAFSSPALDKTACYHSKALEHYREVARMVVAEYENHVKLSKLVDADNEEYVVGPYQASGSVQKPFDHAGHAAYDSKAFRGDELDVAKALDKYEYPWVRNKDRLDYGIPLPVKSGSSSTFYPDFLWWVKNTVWAIDPTGKFILLEKVRTKLLTVPPPLRIALLTKKQLTPSYNETGEDGWALVRFRVGNASPENFQNLDEVLSALIEES